MSSTIALLNLLIFYIFLIIVEVASGAGGGRRSKVKDIAMKPNEEMCDNE
jgi:hypothetical protein